MRRALLAVPLLLAACADSGGCDPHTNRSFLTVAGCVAGGGYDQRVQRRQSGLDAAQRDAEAAAMARDAAYARQEEAQAEAARLRGTLAEQQRRAANFESQLLAARAATDAEQARLGMIRQRTAQLRAEQSRLQGSGSDAATMRREIEQLDRELRSLQRQYDSTQQARPES
jgi:predicted RNase H-like nuclease (RuvC/YqgF family)